MKPFTLEEYRNNPNRKIVTRKGYPVRILSIDLEDEDFPIAAAIDNRYPMSYTSRGTVNYELRHEDERDLFFATEKHEGWFNIYHCDDLGFYIRQNQPYKSKEEADEVAKANFRTFCTTVKIEWEE